MIENLPVKPERAILVGIEDNNDEWPLQESLAELERLASTAGAEVVGVATQRLAKPHARTFVGSGKAEEINSLVRSLNADIVIFDDELTPSQQSNLEHIFKTCKVIDRTALILDIFALHASSREGRLQIKLAQNQYLLPRLRGMWAHLASNRMGGGVGSRFGEGESQLEVDRRMVRKRIASIRKELEKLTVSRNLQRKSRDDSGIYRIALAGYTNAGKSSILNLLTGANILADDMLFATLDSTTRKLELTDSLTATITDTVGFIQKLPTNLIEAFKSTLDEIVEANLIVHVIDSHASQRSAQIKAVRDVLQQIGADATPVLDVFNKTDLLEEGEIAHLQKLYPASVCVSATEGLGIDTLISRIVLLYEQTTKAMHVCIPYSRGDIVRMAYEHCSIKSESYNEVGTELTVLVPKAYQSRFKPFCINGADEGLEL